MKSILRLAGLAVLASVWVANAQEMSTTCVSAGNVYKAGDVACIPACHGQQRLARCDAATDTAQWTTVSNTCPSAMLIDSVLMAARTGAATTDPMTLASGGQCVRS